MGYGIVYLHCGLQNASQVERGFGAEVCTLTIHGGLFTVLKAHAIKPVPEPLHQSPRSTAPSWLDPMFALQSSQNVISIFTLFAQPENQEDKRCLL